MKNLVLKLVIYNNCVIWSPIVNTALTFLSTEKPFFADKLQVDSVFLIIHIITYYYKMDKTGSFSNK